jgi:hypothetical protein
MSTYLLSGHSLLTASGMPGPVEVNAVEVKRASLRIYRRRREEYSNDPRRVLLFFPVPGAGVSAAGMKNASFPFRDHDDVVSVVAAELLFSVAAFGAGVSGAASAFGLSPLELLEERLA